MQFCRNSVSVVLVATALSTSALADGPKGGAAAGPSSPSVPEKSPYPSASPSPRRAPAGAKGSGAFWEAIKKGDDAFAARDLEGAKAAYQEAIRVEPQNGMGHYRMGEAELSRGNPKDAEASWQSALRFAGDNAGLEAKILFVLADLKERQRSFEEATSGWNAYEAHSKASSTVKTYPASATERKKRIEGWKKLETDYAAVKERIKQRLEEAEKKAAESAQSPGNR